MKSRDLFPKGRYPFSDELCNYMDADPEFFASLKISNRTKFVFLGMLSTSHLPANNPLTNDEIIGLWYADMENIRTNRPPFFKQDFIVNINNDGKKFVSYTIDQFVNGDSVLPIKHFFSTYGNNGQFYHKGIRWDHHYDTIGDLPSEPSVLREAAQILMQKIQGK